MTRPVIALVSDPTSIGVVELVYGAEACDAHRLGGAQVGRRATTHWAECLELGATYPSVTVDPDAIYVLQDGNGWTSAGITAGIDLALALVAEGVTRRPGRHTGWPDSVVCLPPEIRQPAPRLRPAGFRAERG